MFSAFYNRSKIRSWGSGGDSPNQIFQQEVVNIYFWKSPLFLIFQKIWKIIKISVVSLVCKLPITTCIFWKTIIFKGICVYFIINFSYRKSKSLILLHYYMNLHIFI